MGQSQSGQYLNTWQRHFHPKTPELWDGFFNSVGTILERPLQARPVRENGLYSTITPTDVAPVTKPTVSITCEGDVALYRQLGFDDVAKPGLADGENRRHWCVAGASHTELTSRVMPGNPGVIKAGRKPRSMTEEKLRTGNFFPLQVAVTAGLEALLEWIDGQEPAASIFFEVDSENQPQSDADDNVLGGIRYGIIVQLVATFVGGTGWTLGTVTPFAADRVLAEYPTLDDYLAPVGEVDRELIRKGYLTEFGFGQLQDVATVLWRRAVEV